MPTPTREIVYSPEDRDFALFLDGVFVGFARSYADGERALDGLVYTRLTKTSEAPANETTELAVEERAAGYDAAAALAEERAELNALGEPMPASADEALARQFVGELNEAEQLGQLSDPALLARYDAKSAQVRALGYEIGPDGQGGLCLWHADNTGPLSGPAHYARLEGSVYDLTANRWYCTAAAWPHSPAARAGAELGDMVA